MIRPALITDAAAAAPLILQAMGSLAAVFTGPENSKDAGSLLEHFFRLKDNQYSFENTLVYEEGSRLAGLIIGYDGAKLENLRSPFFEYLLQTYQLSHFEMEAETEAGEFYLDTISVHAEFQGQGIRKKLIMAACAHARNLGHSRAGLLVDIHNPHAKRLYEKMGFLQRNQKKFAGGRYDHMVLDL